jgi:hypothetical protein
VLLYHNSRLWQPLSSGSGGAPGISRSLLDAEPSGAGIRPALLPDVPAAYSGDCPTPDSSQCNSLYVNSDCLYHYMPRPDDDICPHWMCSSSQTNSQTFRMAIKTLVRTGNGRPGSATLDQAGLARRTITAHAAVLLPISRRFTSGVIIRVIPQGAASLTTVTLGRRTVSRTVSRTGDRCPIPVALNQTSLAG